MKKDARSYLGVEIKRPRVAFFDFSSCEGCQLQILNNEASLISFLSLVEIVNFREATSRKSDDYEIAFVEGSVTRADEEEWLKEIRSRARVLVALGSCACFGGVNQLKNRFADQEWVKREVYGDHPVESRESRPLSDFVAVDLSIYGCPIKKEEVEKIVTNLVVGKSVDHPRYPVCMECTAKGNICLFEMGEPCLGPITRAGCDSWCPDNRMGCWGCRGPADEANIPYFREVIRNHNIPEEVMVDRLECFGGFSRILEEIKEEQAKGQGE